MGTWHLAVNPARGTGICAVQSLFWALTSACDETKANAEKGVEAITSHAPNAKVEHHSET